ncbi:MAG TPA: lysophospholipid acyltransferase family protein [Acidimicrobiales bacterium]|nr:lysophospholipid acyltransferase family protein [Acidimicrobiales bacterium]
MRRVLESTLYVVVRNVIVGFSRLFWRLSVEGREHVPTTGPFILSPVHRSNIDTPLVAACTSRKVHYMGKQEMWKFKVSAAFFTAMGGFPVNRGAALDREAMRKCVAYLNAGEPLVIFPEGTRRSGPVVEEMFEGPAYLSTKTGAPIVPVGIGGSEGAMPKGAKFLKPVKCHLVIGPPIHPEPGEPGRAPRRAVRELNARLQSELQRLFDEAQAKVGKPNS